MTLLARLAGRRDLLVPDVDYCRVLHGNRASPILRDVQALRHQVEWVEAAAGQAALAPAPLFDDADNWSVHVAAYRHADGTPPHLAAAVRLVQPPPSQPYPYESLCQAAPAIVLPPRSITAEVSRLVVDARLRRRSGDSPEGIGAVFAGAGTAAMISAGPGAVRGRAEEPLLLLGLYREMYRHSRAHGISAWLAVMERPHARALSQMGMWFEAIGTHAPAGPPVALHLLDLDAFARRLRRENRMLAAWFHDEPVGWWIKARLLAQALRHGHPLARQMGRGAS